MTLEEKLRKLARVVGELFLEDENTEEKPKRGRGRPPKEETEEKPKRGRGRPPKEETEKKPKRGRGRPPKEEPAGPTLADVRAKLREVSSEVSADEARGLLDDFNAEGVSDLEEQDYEDILAAADELLDSVD